MRTVQVTTAWQEKNKKAMKLAIFSNIYYIILYITGVEYVFISSDIILTNYVRVNAILCTNTGPGYFVSIKNNL